MSRYTLANYYK
jgi:transposase